MYLSAFQASGECQVDTEFVNENITDSKVKVFLFVLLTWFTKQVFLLKTKLNLSLPLIEFLNHLVAFIMKISGLSLRFQVARYQSINQSTHLFYYINHTLLKLVSR